MASRTTGSFKKYLPEVYQGPTHYKRALRCLNKIKLDSSIKNIRNQNRKHSAESLDALMKELNVPITRIMELYQKTLRELHPFEATVAELTIASRMKLGHPDLSSIFIQLKSLRAATSRLGKTHAAAANNATTALEAMEILKTGLTELEALYTSSSESGALEQLMNLQMELKRIPIVELDTPTVVLVGSPNVGKSSIVRAVSSGTPEVNDYPFTTRGVSIGHITDMRRGLRFQVMDTPGLLDRPPEDRNEMEKLTFASLAHLPTAVMYVIDPTGMSGDKSTLAAQLSVRKHLKERFPRRPWIDVVSKEDMDISDEIKAQLPDRYLHVSVQTGHNIDTLKLRIESTLIELKEFLLTSTSNAISPSSSTSSSFEDKIVEVEVS